MLDKEVGIEIQAAVNCEQMVEAVAEHRPDVLIVFVRPFADFSAGRIEQVFEQFARTSVLILSSRTDRQALIRMLNAGVDGHLSLEVGSEELLEAIRALGRGQRYVGSSSRDPVINRILQSFPDTNWPEPHDQLTDREREVLVLVREGLSAKKIGDQLYISTRTAQKHIENAKRTLGIAGHHDLVRYLMHPGRDIGREEVGVG